MIKAEFGIIEDIRETREKNDAEKWRGGIVPHHAVC